MAQRRSRRGVLGLAAMVLLAAACVPWFPAGSTLTVVGSGPLVRITWSQASEADSGDSVASYGIEVDGVEHLTVDGTLTTCVLVGLTPGATHTLSVTAYDTTGGWSGDLTGGDREAEARVSAPYTASTVGSSGSDVDCVSIVDSDGDRLPDALETGTGTFLDASDTGTDPAVADTDGDGIGDGDEVLGTPAGLDLPAMGLSPLHQDLLFEFDWFDDSLECGAHTHRPTADIVSRLASAFAAGPVTNPDGTTGINVVADYGQGGAFTGGNLVPDADGVIASGVSGSDFMGLKASNFSSAREGYFHYVLMPHRYNTSSDSSGQAELGGDDLIVSLYCYGSTTNVANTIMHEVGHNLGLRHGGDTDLPNYEPNYNSVMNYRYQFPGVDTDCTPPGNGKLDYSRGQRAALNESALVESAGICGGVAWDWNGNGVIDVGTVSVDVNNADGFLTAQTDHDDWSKLDLTEVAPGAAAGRAKVEVVTEQPVPPAFR